MKKLFCTTMNGDKVEVCYQPYSVVLIKTVNDITYRIFCPQHMIRLSVGGEMYTISERGLRKCNE